MRHRMSSLSSNDKGVALLVIAGGLVLMLGMCALSIDLAAGYLARVQCQRAADAAALAGAKALSNCTTTGCTASSAEATLATQNAIAVAAENPVMGLAPTSTTLGTTFDYSHDVLASGGSGEPQITVTVYRDSVHSDAMPTFFAKVFGINSMDISASATAEAFNPGGTGTNVGVGCVKPFLVPNCDPNFPVATGNAEANPNCQCGGTGQPAIPTAIAREASPPAILCPTMSIPARAIAVHPKDCVWDSANSECDSEQWRYRRAVGTPRQWSVPSQW